MNNNNAYGTYLKQEVDGASQGKLIVMMYEATIKFLRRASKAIDEKDVEGAHNNNMRAQNIIYELMSTLNMDEGGEVAPALMKVYDFMLWRLVEANTQKDKTKIEEVLNLITPLKDAWKTLLVKETTERGEQQLAKSVNFAG